MKHDKHTKIVARALKAFSHPTIKTDLPWSVLSSHKMKSLAMISLVTLWPKEMKRHSKDVPAVHFQCMVQAWVHTVRACPMDLLHWIQLEIHNLSDTVKEQPVHQPVHQLSMPGHV